MSAYELKAAPERLLEIKMMYIYKIVRTGLIAAITALLIFCTTCSLNNMYAPVVIEHEILVPAEEVSKWHERGYSTNQRTHDSSQWLVRRKHVEAE